MGAIINPYSGGGGAPFIVDAASFDGSTKWLSKNTALTGASDSTLLTTVLWFRIKTMTSGRGIMGPAQGVSSRYDIKLTPNGIQFIINSSTGANCFSFTNINGISTNTWYCAMLSVDMTSTTKRHLYLGDSNELSVSSYDTTKTMFFTGANFAVAAETIAGGSPADCDLAEFYWNPGVYTDFSIDTNRRKFFSATGKPVNLGATGNTPTGSAPLIYLHLADAETPANFATNRGTGGNFTWNGTATTATTSPSD